MPLPLEKRIIALAEGRQLEDLAQMLEKEGAATLRCPLLSILDAPDSKPVLAWLEELTADRFGLVVLFTGEGVRRLLGCAERAGRRDAVISALGRTRLLTRGPKPVRALREVGLTPALVAPTPTTAGVIATLRAETLPGMTLGVQLYSDDNPPLIRFLEEAGATVRTVLPYVYAPDADADRVVELIQKLAGGLVDVLVFTSSPQVDRLVEVAAKRNLQEVLKKGMASTRVAAVGPVLADHLASLGIRVDICPEQGFVMKNLVQLIKKNLVKMEV